MLQAVSSSASWEHVEEAATTLRGISAMLLTILNEMEHNTMEYQAVEGVALLADLKEQQLTQLLRR